MNINFTRMEYKGNYFNGEFVLPVNARGSFKKISPAAFVDELGTVEYDTDCFDEVIESAHKAKREWRVLSLDSRLEILNVVRTKLEDNKDKIVEVLCREVGKSKWEAVQEFSQALTHAESGVQAVLSNLTQYELSSGEIKDVPSTEGACSYLARGVALVISPFGRPLDSSISMIFAALALGNSVIYRPNKFTPFVGQLLAECFHEARLPTGVFSLVHGQKTHSRRLAVHSQIDTVLFSGAYEFSQLIKHDIADQINKTAVFETGGKNHAIITSDVDLELSINEVILGAFSNAGQLAFSTSRVLVQKNIAQEFIEKLHLAAKKFSIGHPLDERKICFMGPLIDKVSVERYLKFQTIALREGGECVMRGKSLALDPEGFYVTPSLFVFQDNDLAKIEKSIYMQTEIFGPSIGISIFDTVDEAVAIANATNFGLAASVFTNSTETFKEFFKRLEFGMINWNAGTHRVSNQLPSTGMKRSGNGLPSLAGIGFSLVNTKSSLQNSNGKDFTLPPGL